MSRPSELRQLNDDELPQRLSESKEELFNLRFQLAMGKQDNSARMGKVRRDVARALTVQGERKAGAPRALASAGTAKKADKKADKRRKVAR
jgi:large subunit ribosomal protein L29